MTRDPSSKSPSVTPVPGARGLFNRWLSTLRPEADPSAAESTASAQSPAVEPIPAAPIAPAIDVLDSSSAPDSERTVYKRVPADLLQRARKAAISEAPPPAPSPLSFDDGDDRTAIFSPPRELLLSGNSEPAPPIPNATGDAHGSSITSRPTPLMPEQATLLRSPSQPAPAPRPASTPDTALEAETSNDVAELDNHGDSGNGEQERPALATARRRRTIALVAFFVFLFLAAGLTYVNSGRSF